MGSGSDQSEEPISSSANPIIGPGNVRCWCAPVAAQDEGDADERRHDGNTEPKAGAEVDDGLG